MARSPRSEYLTPDDNDFVFVMCRSARTSLVPSRDRIDSTTDAQRVHFIESLIRLFAKFFCISIHSHAVLPSELRLLLRAHPDIAQALDDFELARRWLSLCPTLRLPTLRSSELTEKEILALAADRARIAQIRLRLSDISWFLRLLQQRITLFCNREDGFTGRFWSDRFRSIVLVEHRFYWLAMANVDLSAFDIDPDKPFSVSEFTSALLRLRDLLEANKCQSPPTDSTIHSATVPSATDNCRVTNPNVSESDTCERSLCGRHLAPLRIPYDGSHTPAPSASFPFCCTDTQSSIRDTKEYLDLLEWIKRVADGESTHTVPAWLSLLLQDIRLTVEALVAFVRNFERFFSHVAGSPAKMNAFLTKSGRRRAWVTPEARTWFRKCELQFPATPLS